MTANVKSINVTAHTDAKSFDEVNHEISRLKLVIGILFAKLNPADRANFISDLEGLGMKDEADLYKQFN